MRGRRTELEYVVPSGRFSPKVLSVVYCSLAPQIVGSGRFVTCPTCCQIPGLKSGKIGIIQTGNTFGYEFGYVPGMKAQYNLAQRNALR